MASKPFSSVIDLELTRGFVMAAIGATSVALGAVGMQSEAISLIPGTYTLKHGAQFYSFENEVMKSLVFPQKHLITRPITKLRSREGVDPLFLPAKERVAWKPRATVASESTLSAASAKRSGRKRTLAHETNLGVGEPMMFVAAPKHEAAKMQTLFFSLREGFAYAVHFPERPKQFLSAGSIEPTPSRSFKIPPNDPKKGPKVNLPAAIVVGATLSTSRGDSGSTSSKRSAGEAKKSAEGDTNLGAGLTKVEPVLESEPHMAPITQLAMGVSLDAIRLSAASATTEHDGRNLYRLNIQHLARSEAKINTNGVLLATQSKVEASSPPDGVALESGMSSYPLSTSLSPLAQKNITSEDSRWRQSIGAARDKGKSVTIQPPCVEAFNWDVLIDDCQTEILSTKRTSSVQPWLISARSGALPTLQRKGEGPAVFLSIQALSQIELLTGNRQVKSRGIIFGKVPPQHIVSFSGYSGPTVYLNTQNRLVSEQEAAQTRYFVIFNVEKGAHRIQTINLGTASNTGKANQATVSVGIPVPSGGSVYVDLASTGITTFQGVVIDGNEGIQYGQGRAKVSILGIDHEATGSTFTDIDGRFEFHEVPFAFGYPLDVQVLAFENGITHRFQIDPISREKQILPVFDANTISQWGEQLEGEPLHANTGVIFGALPGIFSKAIEEQTIRQGGKLAVVVRPMFGRGENLSETYWLNHRGEFLPGPQRKLVQPRFCSLNVDSGPQWVEIRTETGKVIWSDLVFMSPNVVFPLGPN